MRAPAELSKMPPELPPMPPSSLPSPGPSTPPAASPTTVLQGSGLGDALVPSESSGASSATKKRKKRKKKATTAATLGDDDDAVLRQAEAKITGDDEAAWRARARARLDRLRAVVNDADELQRELTEAADRFADAEHAEQLVNTGLRSAHTLLSEREKALATSKAEAANLSAEVSTLTGYVNLLTKVMDLQLVARRANDRSCA